MLRIFVLALLLSFNPIALAQAKPQYGGTLTVTSELGQGSRFAFTLPLADGAA